MTSTTANPLIAPRQDSTQWYTGLGLVEDVIDCKNAIESEGWVDDAIAGLTTSLDTLGLVVDPLGSLVAWGVSWLMEHVQPLSDALDWLAGDPDQIAAYAQTWKNVSVNASQAADALREAVWRDIADWTGPASESFRSHVAEQMQALGGIADGAGTLGNATEICGMLVGLVRELVRELIAEFVATLAARLPQWLAEVGFTLGLGTPVVIGQVAALVSKWVARIGKLITALLNSFRKLTPLLRRLDEVIALLGDLLRKAGRRDPLDPNGPRGPDVDGDGRTDALDTDADGDGVLDDLDGDGVPDIPPPMVRDNPWNGGDMDPHYRGEERPDGIWGPPGVDYLDAAEREAYRLTIRDGLVYDSQGRLFDTTSASSVHAGGGGRAIFVMDQNGNLYASTTQEVGRFHHSSFLSGQPTAGAGELEVVNGQVQMVTDHSGHYRPGRSQTQQVLDQLGEQGVTLDPNTQVDYWAPEGS
ncbi:WXG100 family type VII secretion target [Catellatospora bangladeshensis]|uniref:Outer membrane channel protein CpnT-like N-terminal domain-containing protein n=1 Tax=Catellatospora bangladeshensis TaxID=310355 RepID=A0A8J3JWK0_9ACTN|nr:hypothetical protein [Catellatospora bangladeshensis]GIF84399.1 hypothetical protein Cba03nite_57480 [Catellatospora bangladeshensis]